MTKIELTVNGTKQSREVEDRALLVDVLRDQLQLTGTHIGCDTSQCGCCTVHVNGRAIKSCTMLAVQAGGADIVTIEGLPRATSCTLCSRLSPIATRCNAVFAHQA